MAQYATVAELKTKNSGVELTHSDDEINELLVAASRHIDFLTKKAENFWGDSDDPIIKSATLAFALQIFTFQSASGVSDERIGDRSYKLDTPENFQRRLGILLTVHNPPSLIG